jgi:hypothetical protein
MLVVVIAFQRINASGLERGVNRPTKQFQPFSAKNQPDLGTSGIPLEPQGFPLNLQKNALG